MTARILDRGYRRYDGPRTGVRGAMRAVWLQSLQRAMGLRRSAWAKVLPVGTVLLSYVPAIVFVGIVSFVPAENLEADFLPTYGSYYGFVISAVILFVSFVAPEILCTDRRTGMIGLYLASPLTRDTYLLAKALATATVLAFVTIGPTLLMLVAFMIQGQGPDGPGGVLLALARIVGGGLAVTVVYTSFSIGVSSLTDRKSFATAGLILFFLLSNVVTGVLIESVGLSDDALGLNIFFFPLALVEKIHGESRNFPETTLVAMIVAAVAWTVVWAAVARTRYRHLTVTR